MSEQMTRVTDVVDLLNKVCFVQYNTGWSSTSLAKDAVREITRLRQLLSEADKREKVARDREAELVGMIAAADESRLLQIRRAEAARNVALDDAAAIVDAVSHEGLHNSMWRCRFERVAADIRAMKSEGI